MDVGSCISLGPQPKSGRLTAPVVCILSSFRPKIDSDCIPTASLGAVLVFTGYKLINVKAVKELAQQGRDELAIYAATLGTIVATNLLTGVLVGVGLALAKLLYTTQNLEADLELHPDTGRLTVHLMGIATFVSLPRLATVLERVPPDADVEIAFSSLRHIDHACLNLLRSWQKLQESSGGHVRLDWDRLQALSYKTRAVPRRHYGPRYGLPVLSSANRVVFRKPAVGE